MPNRAAVIIGINYTQFPPGTASDTQTRAGMNALRYAEQDALDMANTLRQSGYAVTSLTGLGATRRAIIDALQKQAREVDPEGVLVVHFSGHGDLDLDSTAYLLPADADPDSLAATAIPLEYLARYMGTVRTAVTLLDCCHSGYAVGVKGDNADDARGRAIGFLDQARSTFQQFRGRIVLAACAGDQLAREMSTLGHGAFTYYVLDWWRRGAETDDLNLTSHVGRGLEKQHLPPIVRGGVSEGRVVLRDATSAPASSGAAPVAAADAGWRQAMQRQLAQLDEEQLRLLVYQLGLDYDTLTGTDRRAKTLRLVVDLEVAHRREELTVVANRAETLQAQARALRTQLAAEDPRQLASLAAAMDLDYTAIRGADTTSTIRNLVSEAIWRDRLADLQASAQAAVQQPIGPPPGRKRAPESPTSPRPDPSASLLPGPAVPAAAEPSAAGHERLETTLRNVGLVSPRWWEGVLAGAVAGVAPAIYVSAWRYDGPGSIPIANWLGAGALVGVGLVWIAALPTRKAPLWRWGILAGIVLCLLTQGTVIDANDHSANAGNVIAVEVFGVMSGIILALYLQWRFGRRSERGEKPFALRPARGTPRR
ncbi:MAG TPA: caspase family protein [Chloroflexia bacterium]|nr:caspase family protein [Chloroflexia bacterium]